MIDDFLNEAIEQYKSPPFHVYPKEIAKDFAKGEQKANTKKTPCRQKNTPGKEPGVGGNLKE